MQSQNQNPISTTTPKPTLLPRTCYNQVKHNSLQTSFSQDATGTQLPLLGAEQSSPGFSTAKTQKIGLPNVAIFFNNCTNIHTHTHAHILDSTLRIESGNSSQVKCLVPVTDNCCHIIRQLLVCPVAGHRNHKFYIASPWANTQ